MKILHIINSMNPSTGGPAEVIRNSVPQLEKSGTINTIVCLDSPDDPFLQKETLTIYALGPGRGIWSYSSKLIPWLINNYHNYDVIIVHGLWLYITYAVKYSLQIYQDSLENSKSPKGIPKFFLMPHGMLDPYFQKARGRKLKAIRNWFYWKIIEGKVINNATGLLFTCETELMLARENFSPYHPKREIIVGLGIHMAPIFMPSMHHAFQSKCPELKGQPYILFLSRIHEKKGLDLLLKAYELLLNQCKNLPKLVIAGPGIESVYGQKIQQFVNKSPQLKELILFPGMLSGDAKWGAFYNCEAFILPSHQENFGIAVVEALACGKPVLISNQINIWREIEAAGAGIVEKNTIEGVLQLLEKWISRTPLSKQEISQRGLQAFNNNFSIAPAAGRLLEAISD